MASAGFSDYLLLVIYCGEGIAILVANSLLLLAILLDHSFRERKEMQMIAGLAGVDVFYGLGVLFLPVYRIIITAYGEQNDPVTAWYCVTLPPYFIAGLGTQLTSIMNVVVSSDRFIAVAWPIKYRIHDGRYAQKILAVVAVFGVASSIAMFVTSNFDASHSPPSVKTCVGPAFSANYNLFQATFIAGAGLLSVAIYIGVFMAYRSTISQISPMNTNDQKAMAVQRRLTVTLGIITLSTLFFFIIPYSILAVCAWIHVPPPQQLLIGVISRLSAINNVAIYIYRQKEMRKAIGTLVICKKKMIPSVKIVRLTTIH